MAVVQHREKRTEERGSVRRRGDVRAVDIPATLEDGMLMVDMPVAPTQLVRTPIQAGEAQNSEARST